MGVEYMTQSGYYSVEKHVGKVLVELKKDSIKKGLEEEIKLTNKTHTTVEEGELPAITLGVDVGWNKRGSGRSYSSPTGTLNACGALSGKICDSQTLCNRCDKCNKLRKLRKKREGNCGKQKKKKIERYAKQIKKLAKHYCLKTFDKSSKAMESELIV